MGVLASGNPSVETTYASGLVSGERTIGVQVPSGLPDQGVQLEVRVSTALLPALADIASGLSAGAAPAGSGAGSAAARLSAAASVASAYRNARSNLAAQVELSAIERSLLLQQIYSAQRPDGSWGSTPSGPSGISETAQVLLALRRQSFAESGSSTHLPVDTSVVNRGLAYLSAQIARPLGDAPTAASLDERAYGCYVLALYGNLSPELARPMIAYVSPSAEEAGLSPVGQAWLALALWQLGNTEDALALVDRLLLAPPEVQIAASAPLLEALIAVGSSLGEPGAQDLAEYESAARTYARVLMESRRGVGWSTPSATADALWALSRYAVLQGEEPERSAPVITLNDRTVASSPSAAGSPDNPASISVVLSDDALHPGTNWLKLKAPISGQSLYYSLTLRATR
jgi:hypothetical protein